MRKETSETNHKQIISNQHQINNNQQNTQLNSNLNQNHNQRQKQITHKNNRYPLRNKKKELTLPFKSIVAAQKNQIQTQQKRTVILQKDEKCCPICFQKISQLSTTQCGHQFCFVCIDLSVKSTNKCPCCRTKIKYIMKGRQKIDIIQIETEPLLELDDDDYIYQPCYFCGNLDRTQKLVLCDRCTNYCVHIDCDPSMRGKMPSSQWICALCRIEQQKERQIQREKRKLQVNQQKNCSINSKR